MSDETDRITLRAKCCKQQKISIPDSVLGKHHQKHVWGTRAWFKSFARRTTVERCYADMKKDTTGILSIGWTHQVGLVKLTFLVAISVMAYNLKTLLRHASTYGCPETSYIASIHIIDIDMDDPDPGIDLSTIPEHLQPA
ncbi:hypothetical protein N5P18_14770 [Janibacter terrae]|uniref:Transposase DDE domain-containing protein n=1 Tax=Janibacter terrae TaxID=103817 RepID=A0ABZ2FEJ5_9MICO